MKIYSVYVGGVEVNDYYMTLGDAIDLAKQYEKDGYSDVFLMKIDGKTINTNYEVV